MKKFLFVAVIAAAMVSCSETTTTTVNQDSINKVHYDDSIKNLAPAPVDTTMAKPVDTSSMKSTDTTSKMK